VILGLLAVIVAVGLVVLLVGGGDDDGDDDTDSSLPAGSLPPPIEGELSVGAQELVALLDRGAEGTYHAVYAVEGVDADQAGTDRIEVWRDGDRSRRDAHIVVEGSTADTVGIVDGDDAVACQRNGEDPFTCEEAETPEAVDSGVVGSIRSQLTGADVQPRDDEIDGREVRCFAFSTDDGPAEVCATAEGVVVRLGTDSNSLRLTELDDDVPDDVFTPPAEVTAPADG
jgi:hypothetical protein